MGFSHIITIREDVFLAPVGDRNRFESELGRAVISACHWSGAGDPVDEESTAMRTAVAQVAEHGVDDFAVYVWTNGHLEGITSLEADELDEAARCIQLIQDEIADGDAPSGSRA